MNRHWGFVFSVARRALDNTALAEDATQQTFIALAKRARKLRRNTPLTPWLYRAVRHEASNLRRKEQRHRQRNLDYEAISRPTSPEINHPGDQLHQALSSLKPSDQELIILRYYEGLTAEQMSNQLGISPAAAQRRTHRALERLKSLANLQNQDSKSFNLALPALLAPQSSPSKTSLSKALLTGSTTVTTSLAAPAIGWLLATTLSVAAVKKAQPAADLSPTPPPAVSDRILRNHQVTENPPDDPEIARFLEIARNSPSAAITWCLENQPSHVFMEQFLKDAMKYLAPLDPDLAKDILAATEGSKFRNAIIIEILESCLIDEFVPTVQWLESLPMATDHSACYSANLQPHETYLLNDEIETALNQSTNPKVLIWLTELLCENYAQVDELKILDLTNRLEGEAREVALHALAEIQIDRGHPSAKKLIDELEGDLHLNAQNKIFRSPTPYLEAILPWIKNARPYPGPMPYDAQKVVKKWAESDLESARDWVKKNDPKNTLRLPAETLQLLFPASP